MQVVGCGVESWLEILFGVHMHTQRVKRIRDSTLRSCWAATSAGMAQDALLACSLQSIVLKAYIWTSIIRWRTRLCAPPCLRDVMHHERGNVMLVFRETIDAHRRVGTMPHTERYVRRCTVACRPRLPRRIKPSKLQASTSGGGGRTQRLSGSDSDGPRLSDPPRAPPHI